MPSPLRASRLRYLEYRRRLKESKKNPKPVVADATVPQPDPLLPKDKNHKPRSRPFLKLLTEFFQLMRGHRATLGWVLVALTISTGLGLVPLYGTKIIFDSVLRDPPLPVHLPAWVPAPSQPRQLLTFVALGMVLLAAASAFVGLWSRWQTTRMTKRMQVSVRKKVFDHAVRLPLHRVYDLKSGGVASILREDAGSVADLIFSMIYNPARAIIQLISILVILTIVDWRLLIAGAALLPLVWLTHRTWIGRIRPIFRAIRSTRQQMDSHATESFGGMRVVRSFSRQQTEAATFTRTGHLMARQEIFAWWWSRGIDMAWQVLIPFMSALLLFWGGNRILSDMAKVHAGELSP